MKRWYDVLMDGKVHRTHDMIPKELQDIPRWINVDVDERNGLMQTFPMSVRTGGALRNDPATWTTFEEASQAVKDGRHHHIAFVRQPNDGYTFIEIGGAKDHDSFVPDAYLEVDYLARGYTAFFRSGDVEFTPPEETPGSVVYEEDRDWYVVMTGRKMEPTLPGFVEAHCDTGNPFQGDWTHSF